MPDKTKVEYGFNCGTFSIAKTSEGYIVPGGKIAPLRKSYIPTVDMDDSSGLYTLEMHSEGKIVCCIPVHVLWVGHPKEPEPFIALKVDDPDDVDSAFRPYVGKPVDIKFTPR